MVRSRLPVPSLLRLFGALLMLFPELLMGIPKGLSYVPVTDPGVQEALAFAVENYNQEKDHSVNYSKVLHVVKAKSQVDPAGVREYHLTVRLVKTTCKKEAGKIRKYKDIQECEQLPGNEEETTCYFVVKLHPPPEEMKLTWNGCFRSHLL